LKKKFIFHSEQLALTWDQCASLFEFFKPKNMPEYDSVKTSTVSTDLEILLRRISDLIPPSELLDSTLKHLNAYVEGAASDLPDFLPVEREVGTSVVKEVYYLLADYYFKNKESIS